MENNSDPKPIKNGLKVKINRPLDLRNLSAEELNDVQTQKLLANPFEGMKIKDGSFLDQIDGRSLCTLCGKSRKYFCYTCYIPVSGLENDVPKVQLPCIVDIIKHPKETDGKSTAIHAAIISPDNVRIYTYPDIPNYGSDSNIFLVFPDKKAFGLEDFLLQSPATRNGLRGPASSERLNYDSPRIDRVVFIDCTWNQTKRIHSDERLRGLPTLQLNSVETLFWRYQRGKPKTHLATIEAIFYFVRAFHLRFISDTYEGEYDNLLFFFKYMYQKIHSLYDSNNLLAYKDNEET